MSKHTSSGLDARYYEERRVRGHNGRPNVLRAQVATLTRLVFPEMSKADHSRLAHEFAKKARVLRLEYNRVLARAIARYGDVPIGKHVSGIYNPAFPETVQAELRSLTRYANDVTDASVIHYAASGARTPWRTTDLRAIAFP